MKLRDKILYMSFGAGLVVLGMILNSLVSGDADAQVGVKNATFDTVTCRGLTIQDGYKQRGFFGLASDGSAALKIYGDHGKSEVAYLGVNADDDEMVFRLQSKSQTDKREAMMSIDENGGRFDCQNKMGEAVVRIGVATTGDGIGFVDLRDKYGYKVNTWIERHIYRRK